MWAIDSTDGTAEIALYHDVEVYSENALMPEYGRAHGKGDAMWRGLSVATGDIIAFADTDTGNFCRQLVTGVVGCLITKPEIQFVKAVYRRPYTQESVSVPDGGGRVTELTAKPALNLLFPELAGFVQPLAGEFAATKDLFYSVPFLSGYAVEVGMLIDVLEACGLHAMAQVDAGMRRTGTQDPSNLSRMATRAQGSAHQGHAGPFACRTRPRRVRVERGGRGGVPPSQRSPPHGESSSTSMRRS
jgi:glucosyl-3-phosphoglycerate synthase